MLRQEINLYTAFAAPRAPKTILTWKRFWISELIFFIIFIIIYLFLLFDTNQLQSEKNKLQIEVNALKDKFLKIKSGYPDIFFSQDVSQSIDKLEAELIDQKRILESFNNRSPFSKYLIGLAQLITPNVWLTNMAIKKDGDEITLKGQSLAIENLQGFLNNILQSKIFSDFSLNMNNIQNANKSGKPNVNLTFEISLTKKKHE